MKHACLEDVLSMLDIHALVTVRDVPSSVSDQPLSKIETAKGSQARAQQALARTSQAHVGMGIEVGYETNPDGKYAMLCIATITDGSTIHQASSSTLVLPQYHQNILMAHKLLGDYVRDFAPDDSSPLTSYTRDMIRYRKQFITEAVRNVLIQYCTSSY